jgi:hypothetical protein
VVITEFWIWSRWLFSLDSLRFLILGIISLNNTILILYWYSIWRSSWNDWGSLFEYYIIFILPIYRLFHLCWLHLSNGFANNWLSLIPRGFISHCRSLVCITKKTYYFTEFEEFLELNEFLLELGEFLLYPLLEALLYGEYPRSLLWVNFLNDYSISVSNYLILYFYFRSSFLNYSISLENFTLIICYVFTLSKSFSTLS